MKEALWGVLIVVLGLFGIVVINIFQNVTVDNDRIYYLIKESTEASTFDALDLTYYRLSGNLRIVEDKFVENLTRRFAENVTIGNYTIIVEDISEVPPKISLRIKSGITSLRGEEFGIVNRVDAILETKYRLNEVLDFLDITEEEWIEYTEEVGVEVDSETGEKECKETIDPDGELGCIPGDLMFVGFTDSDVANAICHDETPEGNKVRIANYKICDCGTWEEASENVTANPVRVGNEWKYTWTFIKTGEVRSINESITSRVNIEVCTTGIQGMVPNDIEEVQLVSRPYEPSTDNSQYVVCPAEGIKIPIGMKFMMHPNYIPKESVNRYLDWWSTDDSIVSVVGKNPSSTCILNESYTNCLSRGEITAKNVGIAIISLRTTRGQQANCRIEVFDGNIDSLSCRDINIGVTDRKIIQIEHTPKNATNATIMYSIEDPTVAVLEYNKVIPLRAAETNIIVTDISTGITGTCRLKIDGAGSDDVDDPDPDDPDPDDPDPDDPDPDDSGESNSGGSKKRNKYVLRDEDGNETTYKTYEEAMEASYKLNGDSVIELEAKDGRRYHWGETIKDGSNYVNTQYSGQCNKWNDPCNEDDVVDRNVSRNPPSGTSNDDENKGGGNKGGGGSTPQRPNIVVLPM